MKWLPEPSLERTQRWMQAFILAEGDDQAALEAPQVQAEIPGGQALSLVKPSATLTSLERVGIYRDMYLSRLGEALQTDYPGLLHYLGNSAWDGLIARYVNAHPSRSYTLNRLGDHLPEFLATCDDLPNPGFVGDLARLELALTFIFDAEQSKVVGQAEIASVPAEAWERAVLLPVPALRLLSFQYPVSAYLGAVDDENPFPQLRKKRTWVVAYRNQGGVHRLDLKRPAFDLLSALFAGSPVAQAVEQSGVSGKQLFTWFREWTAEGLFHSLRWE